MVATLFSKVMSTRPYLIGMIHLKALPGTPRNKQSLAEIIDVALQETEILSKHGYDSVIVENMHDLPYTKNVGPEIMTCMTSACKEVRKIFPKDKPVGQ